MEKSSLVYAATMTHYELSDPVPLPSDEMRTVDPGA
jgi:hypothetical protein